MDTEVQPSAPRNFIGFTVFNLLFGVVPLCIAAVLMWGLAETAAVATGGQALFAAALILLLPLTLIAGFFTHRADSFFLDGDDLQSTQSSARAKLLGGIALVLNLCLWFGLFRTLTLG